MSMNAWAHTFRFFSWYQFHFTAFQYRSTLDFSCRIGNPSTTFHFRMMKGFFLKYTHLFKTQFVIIDYESTNYCGLFVFHILDWQIVISKSKNIINWHQSWNSNLGFMSILLAILRCESNSIFIFSAIILNLIQNVSAKYWLPTLLFSCFNHPY